MNEKLKQRPLAMSVMTGVTALVGGIEPAAADLIQQSQAFGTIDVSDNNGFLPSGSFSANGSDPTTFSLFDTQSGSRVLTGVSITVTSTNSQVEALVSGGCASTTDGNGCGGDSENSSTFSVDTSLAGVSFAPASQLLSAIASDTCTIEVVGEGGAACSFNDSADTFTLPSPFTFAATVPQLTQFVGLGTFSVTPTIALGGQFSFSSEGFVFEDFLTASAHTTWAGTIDVAYEYRVVNGVPEPASLFLVGGGLAAVGLARRRSQRR